MNYSIEYPDNFWIEHHGRSDNIVNYNYDVDYRLRDDQPTDLKIQIQRSDINSKYKTIKEFVTYLKTTAEEFSTPATDIKIGNDISLYQYTENGPGGMYASYYAFDQDRNEYYAILIFEPGYTDNKELVMNILSTFSLK